jgi:hypothetical protein
MRVRTSDLRVMSHNPKTPTSDRQACYFEVVWWSAVPAIPTVDDKGMLP